ncbi:parvulin-like peptidyl-prolyl isomerase [Variovorax sp. W1I1]|uniref:peptidylprolyl isomerase n=1 Tax=Variovorax sp. W1I1 TaxID=3042309 RepID=UPI0027830A7E|nr:peptidyl-prolyl cis-trans isomerase [Variovorax sp. W1I1]MDQ0608258.1 parvulin-like peptidyl-prolyl isomerase [Variovorax sp. W1I1]
MTKHHMKYAALAQRLRAACGVLLVSSVGVAAAQTPAPGNVVVARMGEVTVGQDEVEKLLQALPEAERAAVKADRASLDGWLRQRLLSEALLRDARSKGWADRPEVKAKVDAAVREATMRVVAASYLESVSQVPAGYPSDAEVKAAYEQGKANFNLPAGYRVAQIFMATPDRDAAAIAKAREEAGRLARQARAGDFAAVARANSQDKRTAGRGGEVETLPLAGMLPELRDTVATLKPGEVSEPVQAQAGFHVVKLLDTQPARTATLEEMKPQLQLALRQQRQQQLVQAYLAQLAPATQLSIDGAALDAALKKTN